MAQLETWGSFESRKKIYDFFYVGNFCLRHVTRMLKKMIST